MHADGDLLFPRTTPAGDKAAVSFSQFWRASPTESVSEADVYAEPASFPPLPCDVPPSDSPQALGLLPEAPTPDWTQPMLEYWDHGRAIGEKAAWERLEKFIASGALMAYADQRDKPGIDSSSRLSPHLHWGEISPRCVWLRVRRELNGRETEKRAAKAVEKFLKELCWREFSYHLLHHCPELPTRNYDLKFDAYPWKQDPDALARWQMGLTGYPLVDAGMRQLWLTGWMHNRVRMVVASFLVKDLQLDWREGEAWFWDTLVDADLAANSASWQWVAGSGADAAQYVRIFNPTLQSKKFDSDAAFIHTYLPELRKLPAEYVHEPSKAPQSILRKAGVKLGVNYPRPMVNHQEAVKEALKGFEKVSSKDRRQRK